MRPEPLWLEAYAFVLPFETGLPDNFVLHVKDDASAPVESGWSRFALGEFLGISPEPPTAQMRSTTLTFKSAKLPMESPMRAIEASFPAIRRSSRHDHRWWRRIYLATPIHAWRERRFETKNLRPRTVVLATRIAVPPPPNIDDGHWRGDQVTRALRELNRFLMALTAVSEHPWISPVRAPDLPPILFGYRLRMPDCFEGTADKEHLAVILHEILPWASDSISRADADKAMEISIAQSQGRLFTQAAAWSAMGLRSAHLEDYTRAVVEGGTAVELLVSDFIRNCAPLAGYDATKVQNILTGDFASRVKDHFAPLLGFSRDPDNGTDELGEWWRNGYMMRNKVVHRGHTPTDVEAALAVTSADRLVLHTARRTKSDPRFQAPFTPI